MRKITIIFLVSFATILANAQDVLLRETFQDWKAEIGLAPVPPSTSPSGVEYSFTKKIFDGKTDGTFTSNAIIVAPNQSTGTSGTAEGNGNPSKGRVVIKGAKNYLQLPQLPSVGLVNIKASTGTDLKEFKILASTDGKIFEDVSGTVTPCLKSVIKTYTFNLNFSTPTTLRIVPTSGSSVNIWDVEVYSFSNPK